VNFWRIEAQKDKDFEWFEHKYPGWYNEFGNFYKWYTKSSPSRGRPTSCSTRKPATSIPHRCWSCMVPALIREDFCVDEVEGKLYTYCSELCRWTHKVAFASEYEGRATPAMGRFSGRREWKSATTAGTWPHCVKDLGFVRNDGKTHDLAAALALRRQGHVDPRQHPRVQAAKPVDAHPCNEPRPTARSISRTTRPIQDQPGSLAVTVSPGCACAQRPGSGRFPYDVCQYVK